MLQKTFGEHLRIEIISPSQGLARVDTGFAGSEQDEKDWNEMIRSTRAEGFDVSDDLVSVEPDGSETYLMTPVSEW